MRIMGISAYYHDSAAALIEDGRIVAAAQEERFTRKKFDAGFPAEAIRYCLREAGCNLRDVDQIVFYDKPFEKFDRILETYLAFAPRGFATFRRALPAWLKEKLFLKRELSEELARIEDVPNIKSRLRFSGHHASHAASAFYPSPFHDAAVLVLDGVGEWTTASLFEGRGTTLRMIKEMRFPHSLGLLYSAFTAYCGFKVNSGEYKLMGLAPYGEALYADKIRTHLVRVAADGSFALNMDYFDFCVGERMTNARFEDLFGGPTRLGEGPIEKRHMDLAASIQVVTEEILLALTRDLPSRNLCLAGGVALNCVANGKLWRSGRFDNIWVQPAAGDAGGALGAALLAHYAGDGAKRFPGDQMRGAYLGPAYEDESIESELRAAGAVFRKVDDVVPDCARAISEGRALAWFQGRMEFGPRSLGSRSILADARSTKMQTDLNLKIKFRESFRPFAPAVLREDLAEWFDLDIDSPYMLMVADVRSKQAVPAAEGFARLRHAHSLIPAVTHVDGSARVQTVHAATNPLFHRLLTACKAITGCPVVVNTSFNVRGEPIVNTPGDAYRCFMGTDLDVLAIGSFILLKDQQPAELKRQYHHNLEKD